MSESTECAGHGKTVPIATDANVSTNVVRYKLFISLFLATALMVCFLLGCVLVFVVVVVLSS